ncbi:hypothetical protein GQX74_007201 [Glossina fuscipes]|nr:hypothetical protein GQX74_007201 [Glossina fuscipes]
MLSDSQEEVYPFTERFSKRKLSSDDKSSNQDGSCIDIKCSGTILLSSLPNQPFLHEFVHASGLLD